MWTSSCCSIFHKVLCCAPFLLLDLTFCSSAPHCYAKWLLLLHVGHFLQGRVRLHDRSEDYTCQLVSPSKSRVNVLLSLTAYYFRQAMDQHSVWFNQAIRKVAKKWQSKNLKEFNVIAQPFIENCKLQYLRKGASNSIVQCWFSLKLAWTSWAS